MAALGGHGARTVYVCDDDALAQSLPQPMVDALAGVLDGAYPHDIVLLSASVLASDVAARRSRHASGSA